MGELWLVLDHIPLSVFHGEWPDSYNPIDSFPKGKKNSIMEWGGKTAQTKTIHIYYVGNTNSERQVFDMKEAFQCVKKEFFVCVRNT